jgi:competence protein ComEC
LRTTKLLSTKLDIPLKRVNIEGVIDKLYPLEVGNRVVLRVTKLRTQGSENFKVPKIIQLTVRTNSENLVVGNQILMYADIHPISKTLFPNKYDFSRHSYFNSIDANGFAVSNVKVINAPQEPSFSYYLEYLRNKIYHFLIRALGAREGKVAAALMIGEQRAVHEGILEDMRKSGLSHILSVSGVHLSLVSIICFFSVRFALSNFVRFAQRYNIKKIAAVISFVSTLFYLLISGMQIATLRSFIMVSFIIIAVLLDREDDSKRSLCFAALLILIFMPESIFHPGFQMSFSAVLGLVASYEIYMKYVGSRITKNRGVISKIKLYFFGVAFSSLVAGLSTAMFIVYHFNNYSHYSVLGNLAAAPIVSLLIMPGVVLTFLLMPFGIPEPGLFVLDLGIKAMLKTAQYVGSIPGSVSLLPTIPSYILIIFVIGFLWITLWDRKWRLLGVAPIALSLLLICTLRFPSLIIDAKYKSILLKDNSTLLKIGGQNRYSSWYNNQWLNLTNTNYVKKIYIKNKDYKFSKNSCDVDIEFYNPRKNLHNLKSIKINNGKQEIAITEEDLNKNGSYFVYLDPNNIKYEYSINQNAKRPWS